MLSLQVVLLGIFSFRTSPYADPEYSVFKHILWWSNFLIVVHFDVEYICGFVMLGVCTASRWHHRATVPAYRHACARNTVTLQLQDGGYALLWKRYNNNNMAAVADVFYISNSTVVDWTCFMFFHLLMEVRGGGKKLFLIDQWVSMSAISSNCFWNATISRITKKLYATNTAHLCRLRADLTHLTGVRAHHSPLLVSHVFVLWL